VPVSSSTWSTSARVEIVEVGRHLAVEVRGDAVPDVCLDQTLQPVRRSGALVEGFQCRHEGLHRVFRRDAHLLQLERSRAKWLYSAAAIAARAALSAIPGASFASSASRSKAVSSP
jgi:hypothetical protein